MPVDLAGRPGPRRIGAVKRLMDLLALVLVREEDEVVAPGLRRALRVELHEKLGRARNAYPHNPLLQRRQRVPGLPPQQLF